MSSKAKKTKSSSSSDSIIYLDNNGTTTPCDESIKFMNEWLKHQANPSGNSNISIAAKNMIEKSKKQICKFCNADEYEVIFTSGGSESNCLIIRSIVKGWKNILTEIPHIISTETEHKSIIKCLREMETRKEIELTLVEPTQYGIVHPKNIEAAIKKNTALISVMFANNEIGCINPMEQIGQIALRHNIPLHTDAVQQFGKTIPDLKKLNISALSATFHKLYGPQGIGVALIAKDLIDGFALTGEISGTQQSGMRGGTEPVAGIAAAMGALLWNNKGREKKNERLLKMRNGILDCFKKNFTMYDYKDYYALDPEFLLGDDYKDRQGILILGPPKESNKYMPNTILLSVIDHKEEFCNVLFKKILHSFGIIVSIGSACNTNSVKGSHVLESIFAPDVVTRGTIRISLGDNNSITDVTKFCTIFTRLVKKIFKQGWPKNSKQFKKPGIK
jgi:cysteine desulfurase